jgi:hypothetical protein
MLFLGALSGTAQAQSFSADPAFSADLVPIDEAGRATGMQGKLHVSGGKVRIETPEFPNAFFIVDIAARTARLVRPAQRLYLDAKQSSRLTRLLVRVDPADPCRQWLAAAKIAGVSDEGGEWRCERLGEELLEGRLTAKYRVVSPHRQVSVAWLEPRLGFPLRIRDEEGAGVDIGNITEEPQADSLFEIPAGYGKFDPQQLIERIKQSDVWVEPPK